MNIDNIRCRQWHSQHIRAYVEVLARHDCPVLANLEPLHLIEEHSPAGVELWAWYNVVVGLPDCARTAVELALARWPEDARLVEMREQLRAVV